MTMTAEIAGDTSGEIVNIGNFSIIGAKMPAVSAMPDRAMPRAVNSINSSMHAPTLVCVFALCCRTFSSISKSGAMLSHEQQTLYCLSDNFIPLK